MFSQQVAPTDVRPSSWLSSAIVAAPQPPRPFCCAKAVALQPASKPSRRSHRAAAVVPLVSQQSRRSRCAASSAPKTPHRSRRRSHCAAAAASKPLRHSHCAKAVVPKPSRRSGAISPGGGDDVATVGRGSRNTQPLPRPPKVAPLTSLGNRTPVPSRHTPVRLPACCAASPWPVDDSVTTLPVGYDIAAPPGVPEVAAPATCCSSPSSSPSAPSRCPSARRTAFPLRLRLCDISGGRGRRRNDKKLPLGAVPLVAWSPRGLPSTLCRPRGLPTM